MKKNSRLDNITFKTITWASSPARSSDRPKSIMEAQNGLFNSLCLEYQRKNVADMASYSILRIHGEGVYMLVAQPISR